MRSNVYRSERFMENEKKQSSNNSSSGDKRSEKRSSHRSRPGHMADPALRKKSGDNVRSSGNGHRGSSSGRRDPEAASSDKSAYLGTGYEDLEDRGKIGAHISARTSDARLISLEVINGTMHDGIYFDKLINAALDAHMDLDVRQRRFISRLSRGTVERAIELDYIIESLTDSEQHMKPYIRDILRQALYQIIYMDSVPDSAAVNEAVRLVEKKKMAALKGFVNAVLRNYLRRQDELSYPSAKEDPMRHLSIWYSIPEWIVRLLTDKYGSDTEKLLASFYDEYEGLSIHPVHSNISRDELKKELEEEGVTVNDGVLYNDAMRIKDFGNLESLESFNKGHFIVQDESSMTDGVLADIKPGMQVLDMCAAPGGKSIFIGDALDGTGRVQACDVSKQKVSLIRDNLKRLNMHNVKLKKQDATEFQPEFENSFDLVIADLPCSGLGVLGHKSDIKYRLKPEDIKSLSDLQKRMLDNAVKYVKPGGCLIYSTCTLTLQENEDNVSYILSKPGFSSVSIEDDLPEPLRNKTGDQGYITILPDQTHTDGFFVSKFIREF
ncbi:MAG: 16S rRNA (cytosine(967)-C(5))-methyltransferase RsmB [Lachnospiraceae bacterium]|nr:16S rRNA (cytosine(967)-C(5))-methyltransferase RsmB [Lachnospiraceae bacterium]MEE3460498.1 16S rRNA (cytosine(967)-C(5))-methyltransferase RsmB [Lachnospiraceae bacterium]